MLTIDKLRLVDDSRFEVAQAPADWTLRLSQPTDSDAGKQTRPPWPEQRLPKLKRLTRLEFVGKAHTSARCRRWSRK